MSDDTRQVITDALADGTRMAFQRRNVRRIGAQQ